MATVGEKQALDRCSTWPRLFIRILNLMCSRRAVRSIMELSDRSMRVVRSFWIVRPS